MYRTAFAALALLAACSTGETPDMSSQSLSLKAAGLWVTANPLAAPEGALARAQNMAIRRHGVVEKRRGNAPDATASGYVQSLAYHGGYPLLHTSAGALQRRTGPSSVSTYSGAYPAPDGAPVRFAEAGGALYLTTSAGPYRLDDVEGTPSAAGVPPGMEGSGTTTGSSGWLADGDTTGYRLVWGRRDGDGDLLVGAPSGRILVTNSAGAGRDVVLTVPIPSGIEADVHFLQVYRTVLTSTGGDPGEDMAQVMEVFPTASEIAAGTLTVTDISSFANGETAYFSPSLGPGLADSKDQPPLLSDMVLHKGYLFGVVQAYRQTLQLTLVAVGGADGLTTNEGITLTDGTTTETFYCNGVPADEGTQPGPGYRIFTRSTGGTAAQNIEDTARSLVRVLNGYSSLVTATYSSSDADLPGQIILRERGLGGAAIEARAHKNNRAWTPAMRMEFTAVPARSGSTVTVTASVPHRVRVGETITLVSGSADFPAGVKTVTGTPTIYEFTYTEAGAAVTGASVSWLTNSGPAYMLQEAEAGSWAHSAFQEYDAWPPRFRFDVGGSAMLQRITPQGDSLLFWTSEGLYRLTGEDEDSFSLRPVDVRSGDAPGLVLMANNTPVTVRGQTFAFTNRGVVAVRDENVTPVSGPIEEVLRPYYAADESAQAITASAAFGVAYESEGEYLLFLPDLATAGSGDPAAMAYTFNTNTGTWVGPWEWEWAGINTGNRWITTGMVGGDGALWLASWDRLTVERKNRSLADYQDGTGAGIPAEVEWQVQTANNPGLLKQWVEATMLLEAPQPSTVEVNFATEVDGTEEGGTIDSQGNLAVRTGIPRDKSRSARLSVVMANSTAGENMSVLGLSVIYNASSPRVGR